MSDRRDDITGGRDRGDGVESGILLGVVDEAGHRGLVRDQQLDEIGSGDGEVEADDGSDARADDERRLGGHRVEQCGGVGRVQAHRDAWFGARGLAAGQATAVVGDHPVAGGGQVLGELGGGAGFAEAALDQQQRRPVTADLVVQLPAVDLDEPVFLRHRCPAFRLSSVSPLYRLLLVVVMPMRCAHPSGCCFLLWSAWNSMKRMTLSRASGESSLARAAMRWAPASPRTASASYWRLRSWARSSSEK